MKNFWDYVENHAWAQWAIAIVFWIVFWTIAEIGFVAIHGGEVM